jgi:hypothetical protein
MEMFKQIEDKVAEYLISKIKETGSELWDQIDDEKKERFIKVIKSCSRLPLEAIFDENKKKSLNSDLKSALNTVSGDLGSVLLKARKTTKDPVVKALFDLGLALMKDKK